jgi:hypothetical protein
VTDPDAGTRPLHDCTNASAAFSNKSTAACLRFAFSPAANRTMISARTFA